MHATVPDEPIQGRGAYPRTNGGGRLRAADHGEPFFQGYAAETARGIRLGGSVDEVIAKYGEPSRVVTSRQGTYYLYRASEIIFAADPQGRVTSWMVYATL